MIYAFSDSGKPELPLDRALPAAYHSRMQESAPNEFPALRRLFDLIQTLRGPGGCPWDQEQGFEDIVAGTIEEAYELEWAATHHGDDATVVDEMGDLLFLVCFAIAIRNETSPEFTLERVARHAYDKIYSRHPHVFGDAKAESSDESILHWERIKAQERSRKAEDGASALHGLAGNMPPLRRAEKVQERAAAVGFDWDNPQDIVKKLREEIAELEAAVEDNDRDQIQHEVGDLFFSVVNIARFLKLDSDNALNRSTSKFISRFTAMEKLIHAEGKDLSDMSLSEMDEYWERIKGE